MTIELMKQWLESLEAMMEEFKGYDLPYGSKAYAKAKDARLSLYQAVEQYQKQEPMTQSLKEAVFLVLEGFTLPHDARKILETAYYTTPQPQREWVELTGFEQKELMAMSAREAVFATEAKLKEKNYVN